jgi:hypothetical protein
MVPEGRTGRQKFFTPYAPVVPTDPLCATIDALIRGDKLVDHAEYSGAYIGADGARKIDVPSERCERLNPYSQFVFVVRAVVRARSTTASITLSLLEIDGDARHARSLIHGTRRSSKFTCAANL